MALLQFFKKKIINNDSSINFFFYKKYSVIILIELLINSYLKKNLSINHLCNLIIERGYSRRTIMMFLKSAESKKYIYFKKNPDDKRVTFVNIDNNLIKDYEIFRNEIIKILKEHY